MSRLYGFLTAVVASTLMVLSIPVNAAARFTSPADGTGGTAGMSTDADAESRACEDLTGISLPHTTITVAETIPAGDYTAPDGRALHPCRAFAASTASPSRCPPPPSASRCGYPSSGTSGS
ncbi:hypothetical protein ACGFJC_11945 [Nonomuraea fuscirosea]|uniref:hypothetical protein n=1 Tax=Nonomuraea fuscirosea TaxID=1291556 RepID=UPI00342F1B9A